MAADPFFNELWTRYGDPRAFLAFVRSSCRLHGISLYSLAARAGYPDTNVYRYFRHDAPIPTMETMARLDEALRELIEEQK